MHTLNQKRRSYLESLEGLRSNRDRDSQNPKCTYFLGCRPFERLTGLYTSQSGRTHRPEVVL